MSKTKQPHKAPTEKEEKSPKVSQLINENSFKALSTGTLFWGCLLLFLFFNRIGYMPDVNIESITSVLYAISLLGFTLSIYTMLVMVLPGLFLAQAKTATEGVSVGHLICICMGAALIWAICTCKILDLQIGSWHISELFVWVSGISIALVAPIIGMWINHKWPPENSEETKDNVPCSKKWNQKDNKWKIYFWSVGSLGVLFVLLFISLLFIGALGLGGSIRTATGWQVSIQITMLTFLIAFVSALIAGVKPTETAKITLIFAPSVLFVVLSVTGSFSAIPMIAVKSLQLGEISAARIAISGRTCNEVNQALGQKVCASGGADEPTAICPVSIKSRIGGQIVLEFSRLADIIDDKKNHHVSWVTTQGETEGKTGRRINRRIILEKSKLLSWQPLSGIDDVDIENLKNAYITPHVATWLDYAQVVSDSKSPPRNKYIESAINERCGEFIAPEKSDKSETKASLY